MRETDMEQQMGELLDAIMRGVCEGRELTPNERFERLTAVSQLITEKLAELVSAKISTEVLTEALSADCNDKVLTKKILTELSDRIPKDKLAHAFIKGVIHSSE